MSEVEDALREACKTGNIRAFLELINDVDVLNFTDGDGNTLLHIASATGQRGICLRLLAHCHADVFRCNSHGQTALDVAIEAGFRDMATLLLFEASNHLDDADAAQTSASYRRRAQSQPDRFVHESPKGQQCELIRRCLHRLNFFECLTKEQQDQCIQSFSRQSVSKDNFLLQEGKQPSFFYVIESGKFEVLQQKGAAKETLVTGVKEGCFGERSLIYDVVELCSVRCSYAGVVWRMSKYAFENMADHFCDLSRVPSLIDSQVLCVNVCMYVLICVCTNYYGCYICMRACTYMYVCMYIQVCVLLCRFYEISDSI
jgi:CRP-like cAMP-binding protein